MSTSKIKTIPLSLKIGGLILLTSVFYLEGLLNNHPIMLWAGHVSALMTVIYGYINIFSSKDFSLSKTGRKAFGIFDVVFALGLFYFFYAIGVFERYSTLENIALISAIVLIIAGKAIYFYKKDFAGNEENEKDLESSH